MWNKKRKLIRIEKMFDQEPVENGEAILSEAPGTYASDHLKTLRRIREAVRSPKNRKQIGDAEFPLFWKGIEKALLTPQPEKQPVWAIVSLAAAALLVAASIFTIFFGKTEPVVAQTIVEELTTDIEGARVGWFSSEDGATVYVSFAEKAIW